MERDSDKRNGIAVNTAIFTIFDQIAFRPLPVRDGDRIVGIYATFHGQYDRKMLGNIHMLSYPEFLNYQAHNRVFTEIAAYAEVRRLTLAGAPPEPVSGVLVTEGYFRVLSAGTALGRTFISQELSSPHAVAVLSNSYWQRRFGSDPDIIGKTIRLNQTLFTIIGVTAPGFVGTTVTAPQVWLPLSMQPQVMTLAPLEPQDLLAAENLGWLNAIAKLKPGLTGRQAQASLQFLAAQMDGNFPGRITEVGVLPSKFLNNPDARTVVLIGGVSSDGGRGLGPFRRLRQRCQSASGSSDGAADRDCSPPFGRRNASAFDPATPHGEHAAGLVRRRSGAAACPKGSRNWPRRGRRFQCRSQPESSCAVLYPPALGRGQPAVRAHSRPSGHQPRAP